MFKKLCISMITVALTACGSQDPFVTLAPTESDTSVQLVVGPDTTLEARETVTRGIFFQREDFIEIFLTYPEFASPGDEVTVSAQINLSRPSIIRAETQVTGRGFDISPRINPIVLGCGNLFTLYYFQSCSLEETFTVPLDAAAGTTYTFSARLIPIGIYALLLPDDAVIEGTVDIL